MVMRGVLKPRLLVAILMHGRTDRVAEGIHRLKRLGRTCRLFDLPDDLGINVLGRGPHARRQPVDTQFRIDQPRRRCRPRARELTTPPDSQLIRIFNPIRRASCRATLVTRL